MIHVPYALEFSQCSQGFSDWKMVDVSRLLLSDCGRFQCRCSSLGSQLQHHSQKPLPPPPPPPHPSPPNFKYPMNPPHYYSCYRKYFLHFASLFPFLLNRLATFCSWLNLYRLPNSASPSRNVFSARSLVTSLLYGGSTYSTSSVMFVTGIICLFRSNCPRGVQKYCLITPIFRNCQKNSGEASVGVNLERKEWKVLSCLICLMGTYSVF